MTIWLISDTHLFHENIIHFLDDAGVPLRPFANAIEMNEHIRERWNATIKPNDHVYHLGDLALRCSSTQCGEFVKTLNGRKRLVRGNHDSFKTSQYLKMGFEELHGMHRVANCWLTHPPLHPSCMGKAIGNIHGHIHERPSPEGRYLNVSVERIAYTPISIEDAIVRLGAL